jgi:hypothetical protein
MYRIDWINGMICLGYFMAGIMWHLNKQIYHCKKKYEKKNAHVIIFSINQSMLFPIKTISQNYEHYTEW